MNELLLRLQEFRRLLIERTQPMIDTAREKWDSLNLRERWIAGVAASALLMTMVGHLGRLFVANLSQYESLVERELAAMPALERAVVELADSETELTRLLDQLAQRPSSFSLQTYLEQEAKARSLAIASVSPPKRTELSPRVDEVVVDVQMDPKSTLGPLMEYLKALEESRNLLRVSLLTIKPRFGNRSELEASFQVKTVEVKP